MEEQKKILFHGAWFELLRKISEVFSILKNRERGWDENPFNSDCERNLRLIVTWRVVGVDVFMSFRRER